MPMYVLFIIFSVCMYGMIYMMTTNLLCLNWIWNGGSKDYAHHSPWMDVPSNKQQITVLWGLYRPSHSHLFPLQLWLWTLSAPLYSNLNLIHLHSILVLFDSRYLLICHVVASHPAILQPPLLSSSSSYFVPLVFFPPVRTQTIIPQS